MLLRKQFRYSDQQVLQVIYGMVLIIALVAVNYYISLLKNSLVKITLYKNIFCGGKKNKIMKFWI